MNTIEKILCPVDLSENSLDAIGVATQLAKQNDATICFMYVAPQWLPEEVMFDSDYVRETVEADRREFEKIRPSDPAVGYEHLFVNGNAGPEIVRATKSMGMVVISTRGRSGLIRLIMGSVAQYVLRNSKCPVVLVKGSASVRDSEERSKLRGEQKHFITEVMHQVAPVRVFDRMDDVLAQLEKADETAAPVIDESGRCIGILTSSDIEHYHVLLERFAARDDTVVDEMFEVDKYGQRRTENLNFDQVKRHMTKELISIRNDQSISDAIELFEANQDIHHLVVLDDEGHAVGIVDSTNVVKVPADSARSSV